MKTIPLLFTLGLAFQAFAQTAPAGTSLASLRGAYESAYATEVAAPHATALADLDANFMTALERALATATQAGNLELALALRDEIKRVGGSQPLPVNDDAAPPGLKPLRQTYRSAVVKLEAARNVLAAPFKARYDQSLGVLQTELTKAGNLDGALEIKTLRAGLQSAPVAAAVSTPPMKQPDADSGAATSKPGKYDPAAALAIINWVLSGKGEIRGSIDGGKTQISVKSQAEVPKDRFELYGFNHGLGGHAIPTVPFPWDRLQGVPTLQDVRLKQGTPVTPEQIARLGDLPDLKILGLPWVELNLAAFQALPSLPKLQRLLLYGPPVKADESDASLALLVKSFPNLNDIDMVGRFRVSEKTIPLIASLKKLKKLTAAGQFNGAVLAKLATLSDLEELVVNGSSSMLDGEALPALKKLKILEVQTCEQAKTTLPVLSRLPQLEWVRLKQIKLTGAELEPLLRLKLTGLGIPNNPGISDGELSRVAEMRSLRRLDIRELPAITDRGLLQLTALKDLEEIQVTKTGITAAGIAAFQKELPKCRIIQN